MRRILLVVVMVLCVGRAVADEGMWMLPMLKGLEREMKGRGLKMRAEDIYRANGGSLKDAIVHFGGGCTGEIVSGEGLLLTNHHCGYPDIQALSSVEHDYLKDGFWAMSRSEEIPAPGLKVRFIRQIEDVTERVKGSDVKKVEAEWRAGHEGMEVFVKDFFGGNQYFVFVVEVYSDVRLVGAPPSSIGKFGGETDNWMWPRHTGDFSVFRVYAAPDGVTPAEYSKDNVPYRTPTHLKVSLKGYKDGDYTMIMGFPGTTKRFMTTWEIDQLLDHENPNRIAIRGARQQVLRKFMDTDDAVRIKYASKYANSSNYWKNSIGKSRIIRKLNVKARKQAIQDRFAEWAAPHPEYSRALPLIEQAVAMRTRPQTVALIVNETMMRGIEVIAATNMLMNKEADKEDILTAGEAFYKDYDETVDRAVAQVMIKMLLDSIPEALPADFEKYRGDIPAIVDRLYDNSVFANLDKFKAYVDAGDFSKLAEDPAMLFRAQLLKAMPVLPREAAQKFDEGHRLFIAGLMEMDPGKKYYPDANSTIRVTYGRVLPYSPADAVSYDYQTFLGGVIEKEDPLNPVEFTVPARLKELYAARDFGPYAVNGKLPVCFISNNDITGGNSGSPIMNARGELLGLAFDGNWDAMSGDVAFEPNLQRTISVDIRYVLFIIDKFAGASHLIDEMTVVR